MKYVFTFAIGMHGKIVYSQTYRKKLVQ